MRALTLWLTGRPCAGKSTIAEHLLEELENRGIHVASLDGDALRGRLSADLGFSAKDRVENLRRAAHVARLFNENGIPVVASFISPTDEVRRMIRGIVGEFMLGYVRCSLEEAERRDVKGMYKKARAGLIPEFTGVSAPFEEPLDAEIVVDSDKTGVDECVRQILRALGVA